MYLWKSCFYKVKSAVFAGSSEIPLLSLIPTISHLRICDNFAVERAEMAIIFNFILTNHNKCLSCVAGSGLSPDDPLLMSEQGETQDGHYFIKVILLRPVNSDGS